MKGKNYIGKIKLFDAYKEAKQIARKEGYVSASLLQTRLSIGYSRAKRLVDKLNENGVINSNNLQNTAGRKPTRYKVTEDFSEVFSNLDDNDVFEPLMPEAAKIVLKEGKVSNRLLQNRLNIAYPRAARILQELEYYKVIKKI